MFIEMFRTKATHRVVVAIAVFVCASQMQAQGKFSVSDFYSLTKDDRQVALIAALKDRLHQIDNVHVSGDIVIAKAQCGLSGKVGDTSHPIRHSEFDLRKIAGSYKMIIKEHAFTDGKELGILFESWSGYDSQTGTCPMYARHRDMKGLWARIDRQQDPVMTVNFFGYFLSGNVDQHHDSYIKYILSRQTHIDYEASLAGEKCIIVKMCVPQPKDKSVTTRRFWVDSAKGFMITRVESRWERIENGGKKFYINDDTQVSDSKCIGTVWMPMLARRVQWSDASPPDERDVVDIRAKSVTLGQLTAEDLKIVFPKGTRVDDMVHGKVYTVGQEDKAAGP